jgi:hypothetical protein
MRSKRDELSNRGTTSARDNCKRDGEHGLIRIRNDREGASIMPLLKALQELEVPMAKKPKAFLLRR